MFEFTLVMSIHVLTLMAETGLSIYFQRGVQVVA